MNWLALAGWGAKHESSPNTPSSPAHRPRLVQEAPDSTALMNLPEMIKQVRTLVSHSYFHLIPVLQFDLSALTQRSSSLDPSKLEYLNKHHLMNTWSTPQGLESLAERAHDQIKASFPARQVFPYKHVTSLTMKQPIYKYRLYQKCHCDSRGQMNYFIFCF